MSDPERLLSVTSDADELERVLLKSMRGAGPTEAAKEQAWHGIAARMGAATIAGAAVGGMASSAAGAVATAKMSAEITMLGAGMTSTLSVAPKAAAVGLKLAV